MFRRPVGGNSAFTLIELLIVVAIIAILAAIAVPNFLEAQVRSKVSRAKADMRSIATAIESYAVDYQMYPVPLNASLRADAHSLQNVVELTTPVAYITALPEDPFPLALGRGVVETGALNKGAPYPIEYNYIYQNLKVINTPTGFSDSFGAYVAGVSPSAPNWPGYDQMSYILISMGPSQLNNGLTWFVMGQPGALPGAIYDPTNGTKSWGDIGRAGGNVRGEAAALLNR